MKKYFFIILLLVSGMLSAAEYTLDVLIQSGLDNAYTLKQKQILLMNSGLDMKNAYWNLLPSADVDFNRTNRDGVYSSTGSLTISKAITSNEPTYFNLRQTRADHRMAIYDLAQTRKELVYNIYTAWLSIIEKQKDLQIRQENLKVLESALEQSKVLQRLGKKTVFEVSQSEINLINAQLSIEQIKNQLINQRASLFSSLKLKDEGYSISEDYGVELDTTYVFTQPEKTPLSLLKLHEDIYKTNLTKLQQKISIFPVVSLSARYTESSVNNDVLALKDYEDSYTLGLNIGWSLWSPWTKGNSYAQIKNSLLLKQWQLEDSKLNLENDVSNLQREWEALKLSLNLNQRKLDQAEENLSIAQERYNLGNLTQLELDQARVQVLETELALNQIRFELLRKVQQWKLLCSLPILDKF